VNHGTSSELQRIPSFETEMTTQSLKETIRRELPEIIRTDPDFLRYILDLTRREYAGRAATEDRFYELLAELRRDREESARKWDAHQAEQREEFKRVHEEIMAQAQRNDRSIGALGSAIGE
jgi:hypothetical protein